MTGSDCIAVIDVGKTNKKLIIFDSALKIIDSAYETFDEFIKDGVHYEDIEGMTTWYRRQFAEFASRYDIRAVCATTHGATAICVDKAGNVVVPPVAYTTDAGEEFSAAFYRQFGTREALQESTATAEVGSMINQAKILWFQQQRYPQEFTRVHAILNFPQYFGYLLTGKTGAEPTYLGCHSYLFDFHKKTYSGVARQMGIVEKLPGRIANSWEVLGTVSGAASKETGLRTDCVVAMGIHDSNSSLLPYLVKGYRNFALNSTGTWCVAMHPAQSVTFAPGELGKLVFYNMDAFFNPVKTSIFMGGLEFETWLKVLQAMHKRTDFLGFDAERYNRIANERKLFILPSVVKGTGIFPDARPRAVQDGAAFPLEEVRSGTRIPVFFGDYETAYAVLNISLAVQTRIALRMAGFDGKGDIFTEGGFRKNRGYNAVLSALHPAARNCFTKLDEATAFGAALCAKAARTGKNPMELGNLFDMQVTDSGKQDISGIEEYAEEFERRVGEKQ